MTDEQDIGFGVTISRFQVGYPGKFGGVIIEHDAQPDCPYRGITYGARSADRCAGVVNVMETPNRPKWAVISENPLTLSPSIECKCKKFHGHIVDGLWVPA